MGATTAGLGLGRWGRWGLAGKAESSLRHISLCINTNRAGAGPGLSPYPTPNPSDLLKFCTSPTLSRFLEGCFGFPYLGICCEKRCPSMVFGCPQ